MMNFGAKYRSIKAAIAIGAVIGGIAFVQPVLSAQSDLDRIQSYVGVWFGSGKLEDGNGGSETLRCRLTLAKSNAAKVTLNGNCTGAGLGKSSLRGTLAYISEQNRYEAVISAPLNSTVRGRKSGNTVKFAFAEIIDDENVQKASADFLLAPDAMNMDLRIDFQDGIVWTASIPLAQR